MATIAIARDDSVGCTRIRNASVVHGLVAGMYRATIQIDNINPYARLFTCWLGRGPVHGEILEHEKRQVTTGSKVAPLPVR